MFWVGVSMMIMSLTGVGDDTAMFRSYVESLREAIAELVKEPVRQKRALTQTDKLSTGFRKMRVDYDKVGQCFEKADRDYHATRADYEACLDPVDSIWDDAVDTLVSARNEIAAATTPAEHAAINQRLSQNK